MSTKDIEAIRKRAAAATPGPWTWDGNIDIKQVALTTVRQGRQYVMSFRRWGMQGVQPEFRIDGILTPAAELPIYDVAPEATSREDPSVYRADFSAMRHPDAEFIAHARQDVADLLAYIDELEDQLNGIALESQW